MGLTTFALRGHSVHSVLDVHGGRGATPGVTPGGCPQQEAALTYRQGRRSPRR
jgi:hypothetical protein